MGVNDQRGGVSGRQVLLMATTCGAAVANLYYAQPLLHTIAHAFSVAEGTAGLLVTVTQVGYVLGLALLVPLGDLVDRRRLIVALLVAAAAAQAAAAAAPGFAVFAAALGVAGVCASVAQMIVPMASSLAAEAERGRVVGKVMSGLLIGILVARTVSGLVAGGFGFRAVFVLGAVSMLVLAMVLWRSLPPVESTTDLGYGALLRSVLVLVREQPVLRQRMALGAVGFGCFTILWTSLAFLLSGAPYHYGNATIGLFGLAGVAGASIAPVAGRLSDHGHGRLAVTAALGILLCSWGLLALGKSTIVALIVGIVVLDLAVQGLQISNQSTIYALDATARSRLTTAYIVSMFLGGAAMSAITSALYGSGGWSSVCILGGAITVAGIVLWALTQRVGRAHPRPAPSPASAPHSS
ncbi:MAG TPA: MFS transporter [Solirubrobacteraceae bacterium]|nr:MFS transporter [Solirubrobacteraceae bacterium]